jgi:hypothetical protein
VFLYQATQTRRAAVFAPFAVKEPMPSKLDWSGISQMPGRRILASCSKCPTGWGASGNSGSISCSKCEIGKFSPYNGPRDSMPYCEDCVPGKFQDQKGQDKCKSCPVGKRTINIDDDNDGDNDGVLENGLLNLVKEGAESESDCIIICKPGEYMPLDVQAELKECRTCPIGFFSEKFLARKCKRCDRGTYSNVYGADTEESCINCPAGTYSGEDNDAVLTNLNECKTCVEGKFSPRRSKTKADCVDDDSCRKGTYAMKGTQKCVACPAGWWSGNVGVKFSEGSEPCVACAAGKKPGEKVNLNPSTRKFFWESNVTDQQDKNPCFESCSKLRYSIAGHSDSTCRYDSSSCPVGTYANVVLLRSAIDKKECNKTCKDMGYDSSEYLFWRGCECHSHQCLTCPSGYFNNKIGRQQCVKCPEGRYTAETGQFTCKLCEAGKSQNETTWDLTQGKACVSCSSGLYSRDGETVCKETCDQGTQKNKSGTSSSCEVCPNGTGPWNVWANNPEHRFYKGNWTCGRCGIAICYLFF